jgi:peroxiredoxin (alkyl hydroperoxide reductase subunit C)
MRYHEHFRDSCRDRVIQVGLQLGDLAPNFSARSTQGPISLTDYRGQWLILFSHPADFTPVCTSEFVAIARAADRFAALNCALVGMSVDSLYSHLAWIRMIHDRFGVTVDFPIVEDPTMEVARAYGMIGPDSVDAASVRATCFLDPNGVLCASTLYPQSVGRSVDEMLRVLAALQAVQGERGLAPADWRPGEPLLRMPRPTVAQAIGGEGPADWFYMPVDAKAG